jgi:phage gp16-like protein
MSDHRNDIAMIKIAVKQLGIPDDDGNEAAGALSTYRALLKRVTGKTSCSTAVMTDGERQKVLRELRRRGFKPSPKRRKAAARGTPKAPGMASRHQIGLIHVIWQHLGDHNVLEVPGPESLDAWIRNNTKRFNQGAGYSSVNFLPTAAANEVIEQLKQWVHRSGIGDWR